MKYLSVCISINQPVEVIWEYFTRRSHIMQWHSATNDWYVPNAEQDFVEGGRFSYRMEAKDGSVGFDYEGIFTYIDDFKQVKCKLSDGREVIITFEKNEKEVVIRQLFEPDKSTDDELQQEGWQAILEHFKSYSESQSTKIEVTKDLPCHPAKVWWFLTDVKGYEAWAQVFQPGATFSGQWRKNQEIVYANADQGGTIVSVEDIIPNQRLHLIHMAVTDGDGNIDVDSDEAKLWIGTKERYDIMEAENGVNLRVTIECHPMFIEYLQESWFLALDEMERIIREDQ